MVEVLLSLAILGMLLTAIAVAFTASADNYRQNSGMAEAMNSARQALARMTTTIRKCDWVWTTGDTTACSPNFDDVEEITFEYDSGTHTLNQITIPESGTQTTYALCKDVTAMTFTKTDLGSAKDSDGVSHACYKKVLITMTVTIGDVSETLSAGVVVRRNL
jgi:type II secretory pathway pseudopilin PulG